MNGDTLLLLDFQALSEIFSGVRKGDAVAVVLYRYLQVPEKDGFHLLRLSRRLA